MRAKSRPTEKDHNADAAPDQAGEHRYAQVMTAFSSNRLDRVHELPMLRGMQLVPELAREGRNFGQSHDDEHRNQADVAEHSVYSPK